MNNKKLISKNYYIAPSRIHGKGLFTNKSFSKGELIGLAHVNDQPTPEIGMFHNHDENTPTAISIKKGNQRYLIAGGDINAGTEITTNYRMQPELGQPEEFMTPQKDGYRSYSPFQNLPYIDINSNVIDTNNLAYDKLKLIGDNGVEKIVKNNSGNVTIPGAETVREIPLAQDGGTNSDKILRQMQFIDNKENINPRLLKKIENNWIKSEKAIDNKGYPKGYNKADKLLKRNNKYISRLQEGGSRKAPSRKGVRLNYDEEGNVIGESSHIMKTETLDGIHWFSFPTLFQNEDGSWLDMSEESDKDWRPAMLEAKKRGELIHFGADKEEALAFGEGSWKDLDYEELELTDEEIEEYRRGGHVVKELPKAQKGTIKKGVRALKSAGIDAKNTIKNVPSNVKTIIKPIKNIFETVLDVKQNITETANDLYGGSQGYKNIGETYYNKKYPEGIFNINEVKDIPIIEELVSVNPLDYTYDKLSDLPKVCDTDECASAITLNALKTQGSNILESFNLRGSAWAMLNNVVERGAEKITDIFDLEDIPKKYDLVKIKSFIKEKALNSNHVEKLNNNLEASDLVTLYWPKSSNYKKAFNESDGKALNTHIGEIIVVDDERYIRDNVHGDWNYRKLEDVLQNKDKDGVLITGAAHLKKEVNISDMNNIGISPVTNHEDNPKFDIIYNNAAYRAMSIIKNNKTQLTTLYDLNDEQFNTITGLTHAIMYKDTKLGVTENNPEYNFTSGRSSLGKIAHTGKKALEYLGLTDEESVGLGNVKIKDSFSEEELIERGYDKILEDRELKESPEFSGIVTFEKVAKNYKKVKELLSTLPIEIKEDKDLINSLVAISHNQGFDKIQENIKKYLENKDKDELLQYKQFSYPNIVNSVMEYSNYNMKNGGIIKNSDWNFKKGGELPKAQNAGEVPTRSDSLFLLNNNKIINDLKNDGYLISNNVTYEPSENNTTKDINAFLKLKQAGIDDGNYVPMFKSDQSDIGLNNWPKKFKTIVGSRINSIKGEISKEENGSARKSESKKGSFNDYWKTKGDFVGTSDWLAGGGDDLGYPIQYLHPQIAPNFQSDFYHNTSTPGGLPAPSSEKPTIMSYGYDDLAITPWDMLSDDQKKLRVNKYGISGTPYKNIDEAFLSVNKPTSYGIIKQPSYADAYKNVDKKKYPTLESFIEEAENYKKYGSNTKPESKSKETKVLKSKAEEKKLKKPITKKEVIKKPEIPKGYALSKGYQRDGVSYGDMWHDTESTRPAISVGPTMDDYYSKYPKSSDIAIDDEDFQSGGELPSAQYGKVLKNLFKIPNKFNPATYRQGLINAPLNVNTRKLLESQYGLRNDMYRTVNIDDKILNNEKLRESAKFAGFNPDRKIDMAAYLGITPTGGSGRRTGYENFMNDNQDILYYGNYPMVTYNRYNDGNDKNSFVVKTKAFFDEINDLSNEEMATRIKLLDANFSHDPSRNIFDTNKNNSLNNLPHGSIINTNSINVPNLTQTSLIFGEKYIPARDFNSVISGEDLREMFKLNNLSKYDKFKHGGPHDPPYTNLPEVEINSGPTPTYVSSPDDPRYQKYLQHKKLYDELNTNRLTGIAKSNKSSLASIKRSIKNIEDLKENQTLDEDQLNDLKYFRQKAKDIESGNFHNTFRNLSDIQDAGYTFGVRGKSKEYLDRINELGLESNWLAKGSDDARLINGAYYLPTINPPTQEFIYDETEAIPLRAEEAFAKKQALEQQLQQEQPLNKPTVTPEPQGIYGQPYWSQRDAMPEEVKKPVAKERRLTPMTFQYGGDLPKAQFGLGKLVKYLKPNSTAFSKIINKSITPIGYDPFTVAAAPLELLTPKSLKYVPKTFATKNRFDAWKVYNGLKPDFNTFSKNTDGTLAVNNFRLGLDDLKKIISNPKKSFGTMEIEPEFNFGAVHGNGWITKGKDKLGKFIDFTDTWDLQPFKNFKILPKKARNFEVSSLTSGKPFDLKNRIYYDNSGNFFDHNKNKLIEEVQHFPIGQVKRNKAVDLKMLSTPNIAGVKQMDVLHDWDKASNQKFLKGTVTAAASMFSFIGYLEYLKQKENEEYLLNNKQNKELIPAIENKLEKKKAGGELPTAQYGKFLSRLNKNLGATLQNKVLKKFDINDFRNYSDDFYKNLINSSNEKLTQGLGIKKLPMNIKLEHPGKSGGLINVTMSDNNSPFIKTGELILAPVHSSHDFPNLQQRTATNILLNQKGPEIFGIPKFKVDNKSYFFRNQSGLSESEKRLLDDYSRIPTLETHATFDKDKFIDFGNRGLRKEWDAPFGSYDENHFYHGGNDILKGQGLSGEINEAINQAMKERGMSLFSGTTSHSTEGGDRYANLLQKGLVDPITNIPEINLHLDRLKKDPNTIENLSQYIVDNDVTFKYKKEGGEYMDLDLTEEQIQNFKDGGFVVKNLPKAQFGDLLPKFIKGITPKIPKAHQFNIGKDLRKFYGFEDNLYTTLFNMGKDPGMPDFSSYDAMGWNANLDNVDFGSIDSGDEIINIGDDLYKMSDFAFKDLNNRLKNLGYSEEDVAKHLNKSIGLRKSGELYAPKFNMLRKTTDAPSSNWFFTHGSAPHMTPGVYRGDQLKSHMNILGDIKQAKPIDLDGTLNMKLRDLSDKINVKGDFGIPGAFSGKDYLWKKFLSDNAAKIKEDTGIPDLSNDLLKQWQNKVSKTYDVLNASQKELMHKQRSTPFREAGYEPMNKQLMQTLSGEFIENKEGGSVNKFQDGGTNKKSESKIIGTSTYKGKPIGEYSGTWEQAFTKAREDFQQGLLGDVPVILWNGKPMDIHKASEKGEWSDGTPYVPGYSKEFLDAHPEFVEQLKEYRNFSDEELKKYNIDSEESQKKREEVETFMKDKPEFAQYFKNKKALKDNPDLFNDEEKYNINQQNQEVFQNAYKEHYSNVTGFETRKKTLDDAKKIYNDPSNVKHINSYNSYASQEQPLGMSETTQMFSGPENIQGFIMPPDPNQNVTMNDIHNSGYSNADENTYSNYFTIPQLKNILKDDHSEQISSNPLNNKYDKELIKGLDESMGQIPFENKIMLDYYKKNLLPEDYDNLVRGGLDNMASVMETEFKPMIDNMHKERVENYKDAQDVGAMDYIDFAISDPFRNLLGMNVSDTYRNKSLGERARAYKMANAMDNLDEVRGDTWGMATPLNFAHWFGPTNRLPMANLIGQSAYNIGTEHLPNLYNEGTTDWGSLAGDAIIVGLPALSKLFKRGLKAPFKKDFWKGSQNIRHNFNPSNYNIGYKKPLTGNQTLSLSEKWKYNPNNPIDKINMPTIKKPILDNKYFHLSKQVPNYSKSSTNGFGFKSGGEYELTDSQIKKLEQQGYEIEYM